MNSVVRISYLAGCAALAAMQGYAQSDTGTPHLRKQGSATQLIVDGRPFLALTGELGNNTATSIENMEPIWPKLVSANLKDAELHHALGVALLRQKKFEEAQKEFLAAVTLKPDFGAAYGDLAFAASENKNYPLTLKALDARVKLLPENANTYFLRASAFDHLKNFKQAAINYHLFLKAAEGKYPEQEWQAKHRLIAIEPKK